MLLVFEGNVFIVRNDASSGIRMVQGRDDLVRRRPLSVGVLVLNYNTWDLALRALNAAISLHSETITEYVLFDDGSPLPAPAGIDRRIKVICGGSNRGFAGALVVAFAAMKSDIVVLFDSDAYPLVPFCERVRERFEQDERLGQLGFMAQDENGEQTESYLSEPTQWSLVLGQALYARLPRRAPQPGNLCVITGCMATRMTSFAEVGGIDEKLGFLDVDLDYSMRLRRCGWKVATDDSIKVFHVGGGTSQSQRHRVLQFYQSRWYLLRKHKLMTNLRLARTMILARLLLEEKILRVFGRYLFKSTETLKDKILGREALISYCREYYR
jgi:GT2 family glycosyltransferase